MASIRITIKTDGAAFHNARFDTLACGDEIARILRALAVQFEYGEEPTPPRDSNGNLAGKVEVIA